MFALGLLLAVTFAAAQPAAAEGAGAGPELAGPFIGAIVGATGALVVAHLARLGAIDTETHKARLECYPELVEATAPLAIYFPAVDEEGRARLGPAECREMGAAMSRWYFAGGGLLLSTQSRDAYFRLARALTLASSSRGPLDAPSWPEDQERVSTEHLRAKRKALGIGPLTEIDVETWGFGTKAATGLFRDYTLLQELSSRLRTALAEDLRARRRVV